MIKKMELYDGNILLRPYMPSDINRFHEAVCESLHEVGKWMEWCHPGYSVEESRVWVESRQAEWERGSSYDFMIVDTEDKNCLGCCGINGIHKYNFANLGYWVRTSRTKKGVATAATLLLARFSFNELKLNRIEIVVDKDNQPSQLVAEKVGATREGVLRNRLPLYGKPKDAVMFSLIPEDMA